MSILLFPFKILAVPGKFIAGIIGIFIAAIINAIIVRQLCCWVIFNVTYHGTLLTLNIITIAAFVLTFVAAGEK